MSQINIDVPPPPPPTHTPWWKVLATLTPFMALVWGIVSKLAGVV